MPNATAPNAPWVEVWAVAAYDCVARKGQTVFRSDYMYDTVFRMTETKEGDTELIRIAGQSLDLIARHRVGYRFVLIECGDIMVGRAECLFRAEHLEAACAQSFKSLRTGDLVAIVAVDIELRGAAFDVVDNVCVPDFVKKSFTHDERMVVVCK